MLWMNWTIVDIMHSKGNEFVTGEKIRAQVNSKLNDSPGNYTCTYMYM